MNSPATSAPQIVHYRQPVWRTLLLRVGILLLLVVGVAQVGMMPTQSLIAGTDTRPGEARFERTVVFRSTVILLAASGGAITAGTTLVFALWMCGMQKNLPALDSSATHTPIGTIALLVVPPVNVFTVLPRLLELWWRSDPGRLYYPCDRPRSAWIVVFWWLLMLGSIVLFALAWLCVLGGRFGDALLLVSSLLLTLQALLFLRILAVLRRLQERRYYLLNDPRGQAERRAKA